MVGPGRAGARAMVGAHYFMDECYPCGYCIACRGGRTNAKDIGYLPSSGPDLVVGLPAGMVSLAV